MKRKWLVLAATAALCFSTGTVLAHTPSVAADGPPHNGHVWEAWYVHVDEVNMDAYMKYLKNVYRLQLEAVKKAGLILGYKIITSAPVSPDDWNVGILYEYPNMASFDIPDSVWDKIESKAVEGLPDVQRDLDARWNMRRVIGKRVYREVALD